MYQDKQSSFIVSETNCIINICVKHVTIYIYTSGSLSCLVQSIFTIIQLQLKETTTEHILNLSGKGEGLENE